MPKWISELKIEWWIIICCGVFIAVFGRLAVEYLKELFRGMK